MTASAGAAALCMGLFVSCLVGSVAGHAPRVRRWPRRHDREDARRAWLAQAGVALSPAQFWTVSAGLGAAVFVAVLVATRTALIAAVPALAAAALPRAFYGRRRATRLQAVRDAWPDGLRDLVASIAAGRSLSQAVTSMAASGPAPLQVAFREFGHQSRVLGTRVALEVIRDELADPASDRVIEILLLAHEQGGQTVKDVLDDLVVSATKDLKVADEVETDGLEMKINARAVVVLPWLVLVALTLRAGPFRAFYQSPAGLVVVAAGGALSALGYAWISRLGRLQEEPRVFVAPSAPVVP